MAGSNYMLKIMYLFNVESSSFSIAHKKRKRRLAGPKLSDSEMC